MNNTPALKQNNQPQRKSRNWKLDPEKVLELYKQGLTYTDIAKHQDVAVSTISRFIEKHTNGLEEFVIFKNNPGDTFKTIAHKGTTLQLKLLDYFNQLEISQNKAAENAKILHYVSNTTGIAFDKGRLSDGESTQNIGISVQNQLTKALSRSRGEAAGTSENSAESLNNDSGN